MQLPPIPPSCESARARGLLLAVGGFLVLLVVAGVLFSAELAALVREVSPGCWFRRLTGLSCPGCGGTRAVGALLSGDVVAAFRYNLLLPLGVLVLAVEYVRMLRVYFGRRQDWREKRTYVRLILIFAWLVPVWTVLRNLLGL